MKKIIEQNGYKIRNIIKNFTGEYNQDLEQEVYVKTFLNLDKYIEKNKFSAWICTIASNICKDYLKSSKFRLNQNTTTNEDILNNIPSTKTPEEIYSSKERQKIILREINRLPKKLKEAIILLEFEDYSYEQISSKLKIPLGTVKARINSARAILKEKLSFLLKEGIDEDNEK